MLLCKGRQKRQDGGTMECGIEHQSGHGNVGGTVDIRFGDGVERVSDEDLWYQRGYKERVALSQVLHAAMRGKESEKIRMRVRC